MCKLFQFAIEAQCSKFLQDHIKSKILIHMQRFITVKIYENSAEKGEKSEVLNETYEMQTTGTNFLVTFFE